MVLLLVFFGISILFSFLCSVWEAVLLSITPSFISAKEQEGSSLGKTLKSFKDDIDRPLSAILTLNTIAHTVGAIGVGAQAGKVFSNSQFSIGPFNMESIIAVFMTLAILIGSEIIPKTLGANYWKRLAPFTVKSLKLLLWVLAPFVWLSQLITKNLKNEKDKSVFSRADFTAMAQVGQDSGVLKEDEGKTIKNLLRLDTILVTSVMTPRSVMVSADESMTLQEFYDDNQPLRHSRIPVYDEDKEEIKGILLKYELLQGIMEGKGEELLSTLLRPVTFINQSDNLSQLQNKLMKSKSHIAIVIDDFGAVLGLVTMEDLFETILGLEIVDETDGVEDLQKFARDIWNRRAAELGIVKESEESDSVLAPKPNTSNNTEKDS